MVHWIIYFFILLISFLIWLFVIFSLWRENRYATLLFDMLPLYPILTLFAFAVFTPTIIFWISEPLFFSFPIAFAFITTVILMIVSIRWIKGYRLSSYKKLLLILKDEKYSVKKLSDYFSTKIEPNKINVYIRHDVDLSLRKLKRMLKLESEAGITSTSFFRFHSNKYSFEKAKSFIEKITTEGFEIGFHYEVLSASNGDKERAKDLFAFELSKLREITEVTVVSAHGDKFNNRQIWDLIDKEELNVNSAYDMKRNLYLSDAGGIDIFRKFGHHLYEELEKVKKGDVVQILIHADWWF
ncbi:MAG: hypothetical protein EAX90_04255 [Candidatus Heimdallarchaeota archaeon]|nr:hypothetical protein [Candidatus Heimdallarchaeota archaeon]